LTAGQGVDIIRVIKRTTVDLKRSGGAEKKWMTATVATVAATVTVIAKIVTTHVSAERRMPPSLYGLAGIPKLCAINVIISQ